MVTSFDGPAGHRNAAPVLSFKTDAPSVAMTGVFSTSPFFFFPPLFPSRRRREEKVGGVFDINPLFFFFMVVLIHCARTLLFSFSSPSPFSPEPSTRGQGKIIELDAKNFPFSLFSFLYSAVASARHMGCSSPPPLCISFFSFPPLPPQSYGGHGRGRIWGLFFPPLFFLL